MMELCTDGNVLRDGKNDVWILLRPYSKTCVLSSLFLFPSLLLFIFQKLGVISNVFPMKLKMVSVPSFLTAARNQFCSKYVCAWPHAVPLPIPQTICFLHTSPLAC